MNLMPLQSQRIYAEMERRKARSEKTQAMERIGNCEGLCGGLLSHHLVDGLCPVCQRDPRIIDANRLPA